MSNQLALDPVHDPSGTPPAHPKPAARPRTWEEAYPRRPKPEGAEYGFLSARGNPVPSSLDTLLHLLRTHSLPSLVWTPDTAEMVPPWEVPELLREIRAPIVKSARRERRMVVGGWVAVVLLFALFSPLAALLMGVFIAPFMVVLLLLITHRIRKAERTGAEDVQQGFDALVEEAADLALPIPVTNRVELSLIAVGIFQLVLMGASLDAGAVSREAMAAGEWWRLFTAPMLHGGVLHFWMNFGALDSLGRTIETRAVRAYVPLVFVVAALAGGAFSVLLPPHGRSVGASGGLMGMFGFLAVMAWRRKKHLPEGFLRSLLINVALIAVVGVIAYQFIDNGAHAGGLLAGLLMGLAAVPHGDAEWVETPRLRRAGFVAQIVIVASAALAVGLTLFYAFG